MQVGRSLGWALVVCAWLAGCCDDTQQRQQSPTPVQDMGPRVWMPVDAGIPPRPDARATDTPDGGVRVCFDYGTLPDSLLPRCEASTRDCVMGCPAEGGDDCRDACWAADPTPRSGPPESYGCNDCIFRQVIGCIDRGPCHAEVAAFLCCIVEDCATGGDSCIDDMCNDEAQAMFGCGLAETPECIDVAGGEAGRCYASEDVPRDAGSVPDAGHEGPGAGDGGAP